MENNRKIHGNGGIHGLENRTGTNQCRILFLADNIYCLNNRSSTTVIAIQYSDFVLQQELFFYPGLPECFQGSHIGVFSLLGKAMAFLAV